MSIYDYDGKFIKDINTYEFGTPDIIFNNDIILRYPDNQRYKMLIFDKNGEIVKKFENTDYNPNNSSDKININKNSSNIIAYNQGYVFVDPGEYHFKLLDKSFDEIGSYEKDFQRIKRDFSNFKVNMDAENASKEQIAAFQKQMTKRLIKQLGEFEDDIKSVLGQVDGYILLSVATGDDTQLLIDVISPAKKYYTQLQLNGDKIIGASVQQNKLLLNFKNEDKGPYLKIYNLKIN